MRWALLLAWVVLAGCIPVGEEVVIQDGDGAIVFGRSVFLAVLAGRDELSIVHAYNADGSPATVAETSAFTLGERSCVETGFDVSTLILLDARVDNVENNNELCTATSGLPCRARCEEISTTWRVSRN